MSTPSDLPPKLETPLSEEVPGSVGKTEDDLYRPFPCSNVSESSRFPASFLNPLYYGNRQNDSTVDERRHSVSLSTCSSDSSEVSDLMSQATQRRTPTPGVPVPGARDNDTDSICFLEKTSPSLIKSERYVDTPGSFVFKRQNKTSSHLDHVYEACDTKHTPNYDKPTLNKKPFVDIFQTMSFKSPLYGTSIASSNSATFSDDSSEETFPNDTYDIPGSLPPSYPPPPLPSGDKPPVIPPRSIPVPVIIPKPTIPVPVRIPKPTIPARIAPPLPVGLLESPPSVPARIIPPPKPQRTHCATPVTQSDDEHVYDLGPFDEDDTHIYDCGPNDEEQSTEILVPVILRHKNDNLSLLSRSTTPTNVSKSPVHFAEMVEAETQSNDDCSNASYAKDDNNEQVTDWLSSYTFVGNQIAKPKETEVKRASRIICSGYLFQISSNKEITKKWVTLCNGYLNFYRDNTCSVPEHTYSVKNIVGACIVLNSNANLDGPVSELWQFRIHFEDCKTLILGTKIPSERSDWIQSLATQLEPFVLKDENVNPMTNVQVATHLHVKIGVAGNWQSAFIVVHQRLISLWILEDKNFRIINLQNVSKSPEESARLRCERTKETGLSFHLELPQQILYFQSDFRSLTLSILGTVRLAWMIPTNARLEDQYLTTENVPVIIDKCLKFISTHGTTSEGIYRLSGSSTKVKQLLEKFSENVWTVHLNPEEYTSHDVASALKRYLRTLPECLLTEKLYKLWVDTSLLENKSDRISHLQHLVPHLPDVNYQTLRRIIGHLSNIAENSGTNKMPIINLAPVFGPTLLYRSSNLESHNYDESTYATDTVCDLLTHYVNLFQVENAEIEKERKIQNALQKLKEARTFQKPAGDLLVGIYIYSKDWGTCVNIKLTPTTSARDVCEYAMSVGNIREPLTKIVLVEVVCNGDLERLLHHTESVLDITLSWSSRGVEESKGNYLCIKHNSVFDAILPLISNIQPLSAFGEIQYAESSTKSFKKLSFEFTSAKLKCFKNSKNAHKLNEWNIEDIIWYIGAEKKRSTPTKWAVTFIPKQDKSDGPIKKSRSHPYFGSIMCFQSEDELYKWVAAFLVGKHPKGLLPVIVMPDLLS